MITRVRRAAVAITAVLGLGIGSAVWATSSASAASSAVPPACTAGNLSVWVDANQSSGAAGTIAYALEFTNISGHACRTSGYPGVSALGANNKQLGDAAGRNPVFPAKTVTIPAGGTAHADLFWSDAEVFTSGCKPTTASLIKVYPPNQRGSRLGFFDLQACTLTHHTYLHVSVIRAGALLDF
jgi:Protein of unknown function (DUF4232)